MIRRTMLDGLRISIESTRAAARSSIAMPELSMNSSAARSTTSGPPPAPTIRSRL